MTTEQLTPLDMAFLCLEGHATPMHMGAVVVFEPDTHADPKRLAAMLVQRASQLPPMRRVVRHTWFPPGACFWVDDPEFDPARQITTHELASGGPSELASLASQILAEPLDLRRPPWELHLITDLQDGRFALVPKFHHALCDGTLAIMLGLGLMDGFAGQAAPADSVAELPSPADAARSALRLLAHPDRLLATASGLAAGLPGFLRQTGRRLDIATAVARQARLPAAKSPLLALPTPGRRVELIRIGVADVQRARKRHGGTVNDVLLAVVTGALRRWLAARGYPADELSVRALVPASQRARGAGSGGNQLSGHLCDLPVGIADASERVREIQKTMHRNKKAGLDRGPGAIPLLADGLPPAAHRVAMPLVGFAAGLLFDTVVTNVPVPRLPVTFGGARMRELYPFVPLAPGHALGVALCRHEDSIHIGLQVNSDALPDVEKLSEAVPAALTELHDVAS